MSDMEKAFKLACRYITDIADCPIEHGWHHPEGRDNVCGNVDIAECWRLYFMEKVRQKKKDERSNERSSKNG